MRRELRRGRRGLWLVAQLALGALICHLWLAPLARLRPAHARRERARWVRWWMRRLLYGLGVRVEIEGAVEAAPALLVANHVSWLDIPCLLACTEAVFVAKTEVAGWPLIGRLAAGVGTIFLDRGSGAGRASACMGQALAEGERVIVFPEGTSTNGCDVRPFHARLFQAAIRAGAPVQAVAIRYPHPRGAHPVVPFVGDDVFVPHLWRLLGEARIDATLRFCAARPCAGRDRRTLAADARARIAAALGSGTTRPAGTVTTDSPPLQSGFMREPDTGGQSCPTEASPWMTRVTPPRTVSGGSSSTPSTRP